MTSETQMCEELDERLAMNVIKVNKRYYILSSHLVQSLIFNTSFPKNSFDRFGDDFTQLILSYLWFEDKVRFQCMSRQWRSLIYRKQFVLVIKDLDSKQTKCSLRQLTRRSGDRLVNRQALKSVLKKCPYIKTVHIEVRTNSSVLSLIGRYCPRIKSLTYNRSVVDFGRQNGHSLLSPECSSNLVPIVSADG